MKTSGVLISEAVRVLKRGGVIAYPTETSYGLGCDPRNTKAVRKIFQIKGREKNRAVLLVASSIVQVRRVAELKGTALKIAQQHWPGALTFVLPYKKSAKLATGVHQKGFVAVRVSSFPIVQRLTRRFGFPIVSTSANRSGEPPTFSGRDVIKTFTTKYTPDYVFDAGKLPKRKPSTVARVEKDGSITILREGAVRLSAP